MRAIALACLLIGCTHPTPTSAPSSASATASLRVVPQGMVGVALVGADRAPTVTLGASELRAKIEAAHAEAQRVGRATEGSPGIFFYGFDADRLVYFSGRTHWRCSGLGCWDYVADALYVVRRGGGVEATLGVKVQIDLYERGDGVKGGMTPAQVRAAYGEPTRVEPLQYVGSERWYYPTKTILFLGGEVAKIEAP